MASAKKCDICGSFYIPENYSSHRIKIIIDSARPYDLCDDCQHNLEVFAKLTPEDSQLMNGPKFKIGDIVIFHKPTDSSPMTGKICEIHGKAEPSEPFHYRYFINGDDFFDYSIDEDHIVRLGEQTKYFINQKKLIRTALNSVYGAHNAYMSEKAKDLINRVIFHDPATIICWKDGTKTVVKCKEGEKFDKATGFVMALLKHESGKEFHAILKEWTSDKNPRVIDRTKEN